MTHDTNSLSIDEALNSADEVAHNAVPEDLKIDPESSSFTTSDYVNAIVKAGPDPNQIAEPDVDLDNLTSHQEEILERYEQDLKIMYYLENEADIDLCLAYGRRKRKQLGESIKAWVKSIRKRE